MRRALILAAGAMALPSAGAAQTPVLPVATEDPNRITLSGNVRLRYETIDGQPRVGLRSEDEQLALRTIVAARYDPGPVRFHAKLHDSRAWLHQIGSALSANEVNTFELVQANVATDIDVGSGGALTLQAGRMACGLGSRRLVAADDYRNTTNGYTGVRADLRTPGRIAATAILVLPHIRLPDDLPSIEAQKIQWDRESFDLQLWGGLVSRNNSIAGATIEAGYFGLLERDWPGRPTRKRNLQSFSGRVIRDPIPGRWDFEVEGIYQAGSIGTSTAADAPRQPVSAWFMYADLGYSLPGPAGLRVSLEYDRASGDAPGGSYGRFDTLFGMRGADLAQSGIYNAVGRANLSAAGIRIEKALIDRWEAYGTYRSLWLAERSDAFSTTGVRDPSGASGNFAGHQVELQLRYWLIPGSLRAQANAILLAKGRFLETAPNTPSSADTRYLATTLSAHF